MHCHLATDTVMDLDLTGPRSEKAFAGYELQALYEISQIILASPDIKTILEGILDKAVSTSNSFDIGVIRLLDTSGRNLEPVASRGFRNPKNLRTHRVKEATAGKLINRVMTSKEPFVVENVSDGPGLQTFRQEGVKSAIIVPVRAEESILGVIQLGSRASEAIPPERIHLLKAIGGQMGIAVQKARLYEENQQNLDRVQTLREIDLALSSTLRLSDVLNILTEKIDVLLPYAGISAWLLNKTTCTLECVASSRLDRGEKKENHLDGVFSLAKAVFEDKALVVTDDLEKSLRTVDADLCRMQGLATYLGIPLLAKGEGLGALVFFAREEHRFANQEIEFLTTVAGQAATAIHNARLYEQIKEQAVELEKTNRDLQRKEAIEELLKELSQDITLLDLDTLLRKLTDRVCDLLKVDLADVRVLEGGKWRVRGLSGTDPKSFPAPRTNRLRGRMGWILKNRKPLLVSDILREKAMPSGETMKASGVRGYAGIPFFSRNGEVAGVLRALSYAPREFAQEEVSLLQQLANGAAVAVENAKLFEKVQQTSTELAALVKINRDIAALLDRSILLPRIAEEARRLLKMDGANFRLIEGGHLQLCSSLHSTPMSFRQRLRLDESLSGRVIQENRIIAVSNVVEDPTLIEEHREIMRQAKYRSYLGIPVAIGARVIGSIDLFSREEREFSPEEINLMGAFAAQAAIAIENAQLYEQTRKQALQLEKDIAKRKRAEKELKKLSGKLERSNRELQDFASVASHDLQEPLRKILAFGDRLKAKCGDALSEEGSDYLRRMQNAAARMQTLINDLLTYSRVTTKAQPFVPVNLSDVIQEVLVDLEVRIGQTGGRVELGSLPTIDADPLQMRQLLQNLIGNALKFHRPGIPPVVKIRAQLLATPGRGLDGASSAAELCQITVEDNGIGFDETYRDRIFEVFQRLHARGDYEGSGIGLAVCRKIARRHGGDVTATSVPGEGATFIITLPVRQIEGEHPQWRKTEPRSPS